VRSIFRAPYGAEHPFTRIVNETLDDLADEPAALDVLLHILKHPGDSWRVRPLQLATEMRRGKDFVYDALGVLIQRGYVVREDLCRHDEKTGRFQGAALYFVHERPIPPEKRNGRKTRHYELDAIAEKGWQAAR
jgi:hypothetical protein